MMNKRRWKKRLIIVAVALVAALVIAVLRPSPLADSKSSLANLPQATLVSYQLRYDTGEGITHLVEEPEHIATLVNFITQMNTKLYQAEEPSEQVFVQRDLGYHTLIFYIPQAESIETTLFCDYNNQAYCNVINDNTTYLIELQDFQTIAAYLTKITETE